MANTPEDLDAWRARRTGRPVKTDDVNAPSVPTNAGGGPEAPRMQRHPLEGLTSLNPMGGDNSAPDDDLTGGDPAPQHTEHQTDAEREALRQQLAAANGRLGPVQRQLEEMRAAMAAQQAQLAEAQRKLAEQDAARATAAAREKAKNFDPLEGLSQEQIEMLDPAALSLIKHVGQSAYARASAEYKDPEEIVRQTLAARDAQSRDRYIKTTAEAMGLYKLRDDPQFNSFLNEDDSAGMLLNSFVSAPDRDTAQTLEPRVRAMLKRYEKQTASSPRAADPQSHTSSHLARNPGASGGGFKGAPQTADQVRQITAQARAFARKGDHKKANELLASINN